MTSDAPVAPTTATQPAPLWRRVGSLILKLAVAGVLLWLLLASGKLDFRTLGVAISSGRSLAIVGVAICLTIAADLLMAYRFQWVLRHRGVELRFSETAAVTFAANLVAVVLPGVVGADAMRAGYLASRTTDRRVDAVTAVFVDRVIGLAGLVLLAAVCSPLVAVLGIGHVPTAVLWVGPALAVAGVVGLALLGSPALGKSRLVRGLISRLPDWVGRSATAVRANARAPRLLLGATLLASASHALLVSSFVCAALILRDRLPLLTHFALDPLAMMLTAVPITPGGLGLVEGAFSVLYQAAGSSLGATIGLLGRMLQYLGLAIAGIPALLILRVPGQKGQPLP